MLPLTRRAVWLALFLLCALLFINGVHSEGRVVCYYTNWSVYRPGTAKFNPQNINPYLCTHLVYAFGGFTKDNQMKPFDKYQDIEQGGYAKFTGLKTYNKQLKTMIAIGGWNEASSRFSPLMANPERRHQFIKNILKFLRQNHFDGIDLDWEYPAHREGGKPRDRDNYAQFVQELRAEFEREAEKTGRPRLLVTMAVPAGIEYVEKGYDIPKLNKYLDWFNVLTYDFHSSHEPSVNHHAPLFSLEEESEYNYDAELNIDFAIKYYLKAGADRDKLVLGIPTYGRTYTLINEESTELGAPSEGPGEQGDATREKGYLAYYEICQSLKEDEEWTVVQPNPNAMGPYAYRRNQWIGYDDEEIVRKKAEYVVENGLGGIMFWAIDNDDFRGTCTGKPYPLIEAAKAAMLEGLGLGINEVAKPSKPKKPSRSRSRGDTSSTRNRISGGVSEKPVKETVRGKSGSRKRVKSSTTAAPSTTIRLTDPEGSSLYIGGRTSTPPPPTTPDPGADFKCEEEGFFQHPRDCKKYFWCLDSGPSGLGIVAHQFTCPSGLYFNPAADSCDFARNVPCKTKKSTTASPVTTTPTTTTAKPTSAPRATSTSTRASYLRTTTTTTTTLAPIEEYEDEEEDVEEDEDELPNQSKDKEAEEDPKVIKELIDLIRKVGGIEELEKHLLRKEDGTISIKENEASPTGASTTSSPISKQLYDKLLSRPKSYNSFRNRYASTLRTSEQSKTEENEKSTVKEGKKSDSKFSSVVRSNFRTVPQNDGLEKLPEFDSFLKEKKQYVTISRNKGSNSQQTEEDEFNEDHDSIIDDEDDEDEVDEVVAPPSSTQRPLKTATPSYSSIRRSRPTTTKEPLVEEDEENVATKEEATKDKKTYSSFSRTRGRSSTTEKLTTDEVSTASNRYKFLERARPTKSAKSTRVDDSHNDETNIDADEYDSDELEEEQENVKLQVKSSHISTDTPQQQAQTTTRVYSSIGRRRPTTTSATATTETPEKSIITTETPNNLENLLTNDAPEPNARTTTTSRPTTNNPTTIGINETSPSSTPIITASISNEISSELSTIKSSNENENLFISLNLNSLEQDSPSDQLQTTLPTSTKTETTSSKNSTIDEDSIPVTTKTTTTLTTTSTTDGDQETQDTEQTEDEVTKSNKQANLTKTTQQKSIIRTRNKTIPTINNVDIKTTKTTITVENNSNEKSTQTSLNNGNNGSNSSSTTRDNVQTKYSGGRRQQLLTRRTQIQQQPRTNEQSNVVSENPTTETIPTNNEIPGTVSSPRPFGFPRRRTHRPNVSTSTETATPTTTINTTTSQESNKNGGSFVKTRLSRVNATQEKFKFNRTRTATATTTVETQNSNVETETGIADQVNHLADDNKDGNDNQGDDDEQEEEDIEEDDEETVNSSPTTKPTRFSILRTPRPIIGDKVNSTTIINQNTLVHNNISRNATRILSVTNETNTATIPSKLETSQTQNETETSTLSPDTPTIPKRIRKVIRKLIRPVTVNTTNIDEESTVQKIIGTTSRNGTRIGYNRSINTNRTQIQSLVDAENEKSGKNGGSIISGKSFFSLNSAQSESEKLTPRTSSFAPANRTRFGIQNPSSTSTTPSTDEDGDYDDDDEDNDEDDDEEFDGDGEEEDEKLDQSTPNTTSTTVKNKVNDGEDDELVAEIDGEEESNKNKTQSNVDLKKLRNKVKVEQTNGNRDGGVINTRRRKILVVRKKGSNETRTEISSTDLSGLDESSKQDALQTLRNKVKQEQAKGEQVLGVLNPRLKSVNVTTTFGTAKTDAKTDNYDKDNLDLQKIRDKVRQEQAKGDQDKGVISTRLKQLLAERSNPTNETAIETDGQANNSDDSEKESKATLQADDDSTASPRPFAVRRPFVPNSRSTPSTESTTEAQSTTKEPNNRLNFRKKLVARRPYVPQRTFSSSTTPATTTTAAPSASITSRRKFVRPSTESSRFSPLNRKTSQNQDEENDQDYDYESEEDETEVDNEKESTPSSQLVTVRPAIARLPNIFNRQPTNVLKKPTEVKDEADKEEDEEEDNDEDEEADEDDDGDDEGDEESDDEENDDENKPKLNAPTSGFRPKNVRIPPGARPSGLGNVPFNPKARVKTNKTSRFTPGSTNNRYAPSFGRSTTVRPRVINRPSVIAAPGLTIRPVALDFEVTTPAIPTKPAPFIPTNTRTYERKYVGPSTETPETSSDNSLIEDLNIEALNARNKKIFDINSKKHTTLKPKSKSPTDQQADSQDETRQNTQTENDEYESTKESAGYATTTPPPIPTLTNTDKQNNDDNVILSQDQGGSSTTQAPTTTLVHIFTLTDDGQTSRPPADTVGLMPRIISERVRPKHKVVEVNRIVEINSKQNKLRKSKANKDFLQPIGTSTLRVESLPHIEQLGEISVVKYVHLVDGSDISIDGHSTVADYTPTEATVGLRHSSSSSPIRNSLPNQGFQEYAQLSERPQYVPTEGERDGKSLIPEVIREAVETSTISLEGLFDNARKAKELNSIDGTSYYAYGYNIDTTMGTPLASFTKEAPSNRIFEKQTIEQKLNLEAFTVASINAESFTVTPAQLKHEKIETSLAAKDDIPTITTTENPSKATTVAAALFPTYVRPIVPLLRPESNESSPLVISIANLDKVILSKVDKAKKALQNNIENIEITNTEHPATTTPEPNTLVADSNSAFSSRYAAVVKPPKNLISDLNSEKAHSNQGLIKLVAVSSVGNTLGTNNTNLDTTETNSSSSNSSIGNNIGGTSVSEIVSYRSETHVVHKKKPRSRKSKSRRLKVLNTKTTKTTATTTTSPIATTIGAVSGATASRSTDEGYESTTASSAASETTTKKQHKENIISIVL